MSHALKNMMRSHLPVSDEIVQEIIQHFEIRQIPKHGFFLMEGKVSNEYMFLEQGIMRAYTIDYEGNEVTVNFYTNNQMVFEVASFFTQSISKENIQALTDCQGFVIRFGQLNKLFHSIPEFREFGRAMLVKGFVALKQRTLSLINLTAEERYAELLVHQKELMQHVPLKHIASYLGITDSSLSRIRREGYGK
ncbi:MAG TPA: Crp/Fnr family transcriptional regulator [Cytophagales bacterium]|nr:Crp/Fnr family transcriptional regulator [Cytophagales bacterium]